jgi:hypothetical protein
MSRETGFIMGVVGLKAAVGNISRVTGFIMGVGGLKCGRV